MFGAKKQNNSKESPRVALCLGGGGARGFAHIGAVRAFEEEGISFDMIVGTSVGALVGVLYAFGVSSEDMSRYAASLRSGDIHNGIVITPNDPMKIGRIVSDFLGSVDISQAPTRFAAVATDLVEARQAVLDRGNAAAVVASSCAVPILYRPMIMGGRHLVDGGLLNNVPADVCRIMGADKVVTVDVHPSRGGGTDGVGLIDVIKATVHIMTANSSVDGLRRSDVIIAPDTGLYSSRRKDGWQEMTELGYQAAKEKMKAVKSLFE